MQSEKREQCRIRLRWTAVKLDFTSTTPSTELLKQNRCNAFTSTYHILYNIPCVQEVAVKCTVYFNWISLSQRQFLFFPKIRIDKYLIKAHRSITHQLNEKLFDSRFSFSLCLSTRTFHTSMAYALGAYLIGCCQSPVK